MGSPLIFALVATIGRSKYSKSSRCTPVLAKKMPILLRFGATLGAIKIALALKIAEKLAGKRTKSPSLSEWAPRASAVHACAEHEPCKFIVCCGLGSLTAHCKAALSAAFCKSCSHAPRREFVLSAAYCKLEVFAELRETGSLAAGRKSDIFIESCKFCSSACQESGDTYRSSLPFAANCDFSSLIVSCASLTACGELKFLAAYCKSDPSYARSSLFAVHCESSAASISQAKLRCIVLLKICALCNPSCSAQSSAPCVLNFCAAKLRKFRSSEPCPCVDFSCSPANLGDIEFLLCAFKFCVPKSAAKPAAVRQTNSRFFKITIGLTLQSISASSSALKLAARHACAASRHMIAKGLLGRFLSVRSMRTARSFVASQTI